MSRGRVRHWLEHACFRVAWLGALLPPEVVVALGGQLLGLTVGGLLRVRRREVERHLAWAFPDRPEPWRRRMARACYRHFGGEALATLRAASWSSERVIERTTMSGFEKLRRAHQEGKGVVLLTGHLGNWELGGAAIAARGLPLEVVGKGMSNRRFQADLFRLRESLGMNVIEMGRASKPVLRALASGKVVALLGDQRAHRGGVPVPFFGRSASTAKGPAFFAARSRAPVFVAFARRERGWRARYSVAFEQLAFSPTGDEETDAARLGGAYNRVLEAAIRLAPEQYFWHHRRWKEPAGKELLRDG